MRGLWSLRSRCPAGGAVNKQGGALTLETKTLLGHHHPESVASNHSETKKHKPTENTSTAPEGPGHTDRYPPFLLTASSRQEGSLSSRLSRVGEVAPGDGNPATIGAIKE